MTSKQAKHKYMLGSDVRADGKQYKACQMKKNVVRVSTSGEVFTSNDDLLETFEVHYNAQSEVFTGNVPLGGTLITTIPKDSPLMTV